MNFANPISFRGVFPSYSAALAAAPDTCDLTPIARGPVATLPDRTAAPGAGDHAPLFWLARLLPELTALFEFRACIGAKHPSYVRYLPALAKPSWRLSRPGSLDLSEASGCDLLLCSSSLAFVEPSLAELLAAVEQKQKPRYLIVNSTPLWRAETRYTLHCSAGAYRPYKVESEQRFLSGLARLGYEVVDRWQNPAKRSALSAPLFDPQPTFHGFHFRLR